tara:strand:+ start:233 stop:400 length:168 start_codon:yes stop_codon:yes gene_type:complete
MKGASICGIVRLFKNCDNPLGVTNLAHFTFAVFTILMKMDRTDKLRFDLLESFLI